MKFCILFVFLLAILPSCEKNSSMSTYRGSKLQLVPEVEEFFDEMNEFIRVYLNEPEVDNVIFEYTDIDTGPLESPARGYCDRSESTPRIVLYRADWFGPYAGDSTMKKASFYHLIGHCVFEKEHNDERTYDSMSGKPDGATSFMHSNFGYHLFPPAYGGNTHRLTPERMVDLQRAFFDYQGPL